jgi:hypothetical protein
VISKKNHTLGYGFKYLQKIYSLAYGCTARWRARREQGKKIIDVMHSKMES